MIKIEIGTDAFSRKQPVVVASMSRNQKGSSLSGRVMFVAVKEAILALLRFYWPLLLPVLAAAAQYFSAVPWPYFVMVLAVTVAVSIWAVNQLRRPVFRGNRMKYEIRRI